MIIAVDFTPYQKGGANGGIVPLTVETLKGLNKSPELTFIAITNETNYGDLAFLDMIGVPRICLDRTKRIEEESEKLRKTPIFTQNIIPTQVPKESFLHKVYMIFRRVGILVMPHGLWLKLLPYRDARRAKRAAKAGLVANNNAKIDSLEHSETDNKLLKVNLQNIIGKKVDWLYCPFTAINFYDPKVKILSILHDIQHCYYPWFFSGEEILTRNKFYNNIIKMQPYIIAVSDYSRACFIEKYNYPTEKIKTIHSSVQDRFNEFTNIECQRALLTLDMADEQFIIYPANIWKHKNHIALLTAWNMHLHRNPDSKLKLVLTGFNTNVENKIIDAATTMGIDKTIKFLGYVTNLQLAALMRNCEFLIFPSLYEGFGMPVLEAMAQNTAVVCSNATSLPKIGDDCVFYFDPRDPAKICDVMEYVLAHPAEVAQKKELYAKHLKKFDFNNYIQKYKLVFMQSSKGENRQ